jgi:hypothetical protein
VSGLLPALGGGAGNVIPLAAGGLSGVLAMSALIATSVVAVNPAPAPVPANLVVSGCMGDGPAIGVAKPGDQLWVTGRSLDGAYLRVHVPGPIGEGWVLADHVTLLAGDPIPVAACIQVAGATGTPGPKAVPPTASPTAGPTATARPTSRPTATPTIAAPTQSVATATPTARPTPNVGPVFSINPPQVSPARIGTNPLGTGYCGTSGVMAGLKTALKDQDGVAAVQLWVQKPESSSFTLLNHGFSKDGAYWYAWIDTAKDKITVAGTLKYRAVAVDTKSVRTTSSVGSLTIFRCDTEATFRGGINTTLAPYDTSLDAYKLDPCKSFSIPFRYTITDPDGVASVSLAYKITSISKPWLAPLEDDITLLPGSNNTWRGGTKLPPRGVVFSEYSRVTWIASSVDDYEGTSRDPRFLLTRRSATVYWVGNCGVE